MNEIELKPCPYCGSDNKKRVGDVCERCRNEVDDKNARRRKGRSGSNVVGR